MTETTVSNTEATILALQEYVCTVLNAQRPEANLTPKLLSEGWGIGAKYSDHLGIICIHYKDRVFSHKTVFSLKTGGAVQLNPETGKVETFRTRSLELLIPEYTDYNKLTEFKTKLDKYLSRFPEYSKRVEAGAQAQTDRYEKQHREDIQRREIAVKAAAIVGGTAAWGTVKLPEGSVFKSLEASKKEGAVVVHLDIPIDQLATFKAFAKQLLQPDSFGA